MTTRTRALAAAAGLAGAVLPLAAAGTAQAATTDYPSTQSPVQGPTAVLATAGNAAASLMDANDDLTGNARPEDANGTETQYPQADPRFVEGPAGGLLLNGPFE
ncbi:MAG TPA: hypothetical protein VGH76_16715 [Actinomycetospora sp.]|jgi:hypothetical protein|uniref:hypothetical protein n=1 Tax=Actinomycetospora sp. TaxID=1872135 RepID=UPI002F41B505